MKQHRTYFLLFIVLIIFLGSVGYSYGKPASAPNNLFFSGLKTYKKLIYSYVPDTTSYRQKLENIIRLDYSSTGRITDSTFLDSAGLLLSIQSYLYDQNGFLLTVKQYNSTNTLQLIETFSYDSLGNCNERNWTDTNLVHLKRVQNKFNRSGMITRSIQTNLIDSTSNNIMFLYDDNNILLEKRWYDHQYILEKKIEYDPAGHLTGSLTFLPEGSTQWKYVYWRNSISNQLESHIIKTAEEQRKTEFIHNPREKQTEMLQYDVRDSLVFRIVSSYDDNSDYTSILEYDDKNNLVFKTTYEYDTDHRLRSEHYFESDYSTGELIEVPYKLVIYEYEDHHH